MMAAAAAATVMWSMAGIVTKLHWKHKFSPRLLWLWWQHKQ
jgi:hypothetical protein